MGCIFSKNVNVNDNDEIKSTQKKNEINQNPNHEKKETNHLEIINKEDNIENQNVLQLKAKKKKIKNNVFEIIHKEKVTSTMPESNKHIDELNIQKPFILNAVEQTAGKGKGNRQWKSSIIGNVYTTTCIPEHMIPEQLKNIQIFNKIVSLSIIKELNKCEKGNFFVKQPNDILCKDGCKMGGILIKPYNGYYTIGFGVNLVGKPEDDQMREGGKKPCFLGEHIKDKNNIPNALDFSIEVSNDILSYMNPNITEEDINKEYFSNELISNAIVGNAMKSLIKI